MTINTDNTIISTFVAIDIAKHRHDVLVEYHTDYPMLFGACF